MEVSTKIKELRTDKGWSQEQMAEKLNVSRQAITKWETGTGTPDVGNLAAIAQLFGVSTDELIFGRATGSAGGAAECDRFESITSLDLSSKRHYDIKVGCAHIVTLRATDGEKATVRLASDTISDLERAFKVELDTEGRSFDIDVINTGVVADALARKELDVTIELPAALSTGAELELSTDELRIENVAFDLEVGGQVGNVWLAGVEAHVELDVPIDMEVWADDVRGKLDVNQIGATSTLHIAHDAPFTAATRGHLGKRTLRFTRNGEPAEAPATENAPLAIELAGARCELTIDSIA